MNHSSTKYSEYLEKLERESTKRSIPSSQEGLLDLVSNDYLGLSARSSEFKEEFSERFPDAYFSSSASRLLSRNQKYHQLLEDKLEGLYSKSVLLFNSGYHANVGILSALSSPDTLIIDDTLMHASGIDGIMLGKSLRKGHYLKFPHNDAQALEKIIVENESRFETIVVVTEAIFSMDGDLAPLHELVEIKKRHSKVLLYLDEAHSIGVRGRLGLGLAEEYGLLSEVDILVGTFGKALASSGAFVATHSEIRDYLLNTSRSFIFSTALPPINNAWTLLMLEKSIGMEEERNKLSKLSEDFSILLNGRDEKPSQSRSQIVPFICGSAKKAMKSAELLRTHGFDVLPIRYPTVAKGSERIRFSLNSSLSISQLSPIPSLLSTLLKSS